MINIDKFDYKKCNIIKPLRFMVKFMLKNLIKFNEK